MGEADRLSILSSSCEVVVVGVRRQLHGAHMHGECRAQLLPNVDGIRNHPWSNVTLPGHARGGYRPASIQPGTAGPVACEDCWTSCL